LIVIVVADPGAPRTVLALHDICWQYANNNLAEAPQPSGRTRACVGRAMHQIGMVVDVLVRHWCRGRETSAAIAVGLRQVVDQTSSESARLNRFSLWLCKCNPLLRLCFMRSDTQLGLAWRETHRVRADSFQIRQLYPRSACLPIKSPTRDLSAKVSSVIEKPSWKLATSCFAFFRLAKGMSLQQLR
jgi:hypothetical protein